MPWHGLKSQLIFFPQSIYNEDKSTSGYYYCNFKIVALFVFSIAENLLNSESSLIFYYFYLGRRQISNFKEEKEKVVVNFVCPASQLTNNRSARSSVIEIPSEWANVKRFAINSLESTFNWSHIGFAVYEDLWKLFWEKKKKARAFEIRFGFWIIRARWTHFPFQIWRYEFG
jgi:hypothetical protein